MQITKQNNIYQISFNYRPQLVEAIKQLNGRRFNPTTKVWTVPTSEKEAVEQFAKRFGFQFAGQQPAVPEKIKEIPPMPELTTKIPLALTPFHYQEQGIAYCLQHKHAIIGDKPGLGKTGQAIATIVAAQSYPCLIVCPATLKINWQREIEMWTGKKQKAIILDDNCKNTWHLFYEAMNVNFFIVNYESLAKFFVAEIERKKRFTLANIKFKTQINIFKSIVIDESHRCKNGYTQQSKFCMGIAKGKEYTLLLTGTPVINKPIDLIPQLHIMGMLGAFGGYKYFMNRYCSGEKQASNLKELNYLLNLYCFFQREKKDVLKDLPAKTRQTIICEITNRKEYSDAESDLIKYLREYCNADDKAIKRAMRGEVIVRITKLRQIAARGKVEDVKAFIDDMIDSGEKLILFMNLIELGDAFKEAYPNNAVIIRGGMNDSAKQAAVDTFQNDDNCKLAICNIKAAGVGLTLTASSRVAFVEFPWTYADCEQCEDRAHRIGQDSNVTCYYFLGRNTIDERVYQIINEKKNIAQTITGATEEVEENIIDNLINIFNQK